MQVQKRNGEKQDFNIQKIRDQIAFACKGVDVNQIELESKLQSVMRNNIKTSDIQELIISSATQLISVENPDWILVAGRLSMYNLHREVYKNTGFECKDFTAFLENVVKKGLYRSDFVSSYTPEEILELSAYTFASTELDYTMVLPQVLSLKSKYLLRNKKGVIEYPAFADMASAMILGKSADNKIKTVKRYFDSLRTFQISLATPFKANLRRLNGNTGSCFILPVGDSLDQISKSWTDMAKISKEGGGIGVYLGEIRPSSTASKNIPNSNNITRWVKIINDIAVAVNQRGVRKGAITPALDWYHMDIESFIRVKSELGGDLREKCFDVFPQVVVDTYFVDAVKTDREVYLFNHHEVKEKLGIDITKMVDDDLLNAHFMVAEAIENGRLKNFTKIKAKVLWVEFLKVWIETGDFYICHRDNMNKSNYLKDYAIANSGNLCQESWSVTKTATEWKTSREDSNLITTETDGLYHSCSLISLNVGVLLTDKELKSACSNAVQMLDLSIDNGEMPVLEAYNSSKLLRNIGIGVMGVADWMAHNKYSYENEAGQTALIALFEKIAYYCYTESIELAKKYGSYPMYSQADYSKILGESPEVLTKESLNNFDWITLQNDIKTYGIRNFLILALAPNTSSGILMNATASYLPPHSKLNYQTLANMSTPIIPRYLKNRFWYYKGKYQYKAEDIIYITRKIQRYVDTGISMEVLINPELTNIKNISDAIIEGFHTGELKTVYYSLTIDTKKETCTDCAN